LSKEEVMRSIRAVVSTVVLLSAMIAPVAQAGPVPGQGNWQTTLQARDIDGNGSTDAYYDTQLNITWLANFNTNGLMNWNAANTWATTNTFFGLGGWRLPTTNDTGTSGCDFAFTNTDCGFNVQTSTGNPVNSELAHLYYVTLGNLAAFDTSGNPQSGFGLTNTADLVDFQSSAYWSGTVYAPDSNGAWLFLTGTFNSTGLQGNDVKDFALYAVAVRSGDVGASVPLPPTAALMLLMFGAMGLICRKRPA
jgi:hypothetical protein